MVFLHTLCMGARRLHRVPLPWNVSQASLFPKPGKHADVNKCTRDRLIHVLDPLGKGSFAHVVCKHKTEQQQATMVHNHDPWIFEIQVYRRRNRISTSVEQSMVNAQVFTRFGSVRSFECLWKRWSRKHGLGFVTFHWTIIFGFSEIEIPRHIFSI